VAKSRFGENQPRSMAAPRSRALAAGGSRLSRARGVAALAPSGRQGDEEYPYEVIRCLGRRRVVRQSALAGRFRSEPVSSLAHFFIEAMNLASPDDNDASRRSAGQDPLELPVAAEPASSMSIAMSVLLHAPVAGMLLDSEMAIRGSNAGLADLLAADGRHPEDSALASAWPALAEHPRLRALLVRAFADDSFAESIRIQLVCSKGGKLVLCCTAMSADIQFNGQRAVFLWLQDVTREQGLEEDLREAESRVQSILGSSVDAIVLIDERGKVKSFNLAAERLFGYTQDELLGENVRLLMPEPYSAEHDGYLANYMRTRKRKVIGIGREVTGQRKDGTLFPMELSVSEIEWCGRRHFLGTVRDVTVQKRSEEALRNSEARVRAILDTAVDAIITIDANGLVKSFNPAAQSLFGYSAHEVIGENVSMLMPEPYQSQHDDYLKNYLVTGHRRVIGIGREVVGKRKNGQIFPMELSISEVVQGNICTFTGIVRDVSERKRAEERLRNHTLKVESARSRLEAQAQLLEEQAYKLREAQERSQIASRAKSDFLANMSHEIRTPMTAILGYAELLSEGLRDPDHVAMAEAMRRNGRYLMCIVDDILDLSKIEAGKMVLEDRVFSPKVMLHDVVEMLRPRCVEKGIGISAEVDANLPDRLSGDPTRVRQVLFNLIGNAVKFTEHGSVAIAVGHVTMGRFEVELSWRIKDTGIGIGRDQVVHLFQPFTQADASTTRKHGGTGLGLAISRRLANLMGGDISVASEVGQGSVFHFTMRARRTIEPEVLKDNLPGRSRPAQLPLLGLQGCRLLVVDDGRDNQLLVQRFLQMEGAEVLLADDGGQALDLLLRHPMAESIDLVLMDMQMPEIDGYEATRRLRSAGFAKPILALTANAMSGDRERCLDAGCDDYLSKPIARKALLNLIAQYLRSGDSEHRLKERPTQ